MIDIAPSRPTPGAATPVDWQPDGTPRSAMFNDIYRSSGLDGQGGLNQARHVFLGGCGLWPAEHSIWKKSGLWTILENGFGLGLNFLATWQAWRDDPLRPQRLIYTSIEAWPVTRDDLRRSTKAFPELQELCEALCLQWVGLLPGLHVLEFERGQVQLQLWIGDVQSGLKAMDTPYNSVFLDGFDPAINPDMWSLSTLKAMSRLCKLDTRLATWTVARAVRDHLAQCGFQIEKSAGLPPKRHCLQARFAPRWTTRTRLRGPEMTPQPGPGTCVVVGAGLAGSAVAYSMACRGWHVTVIEQAAACAQGASALPVGLTAPHTSPDDNLLSKITRSGVRATLVRAGQLLNSGQDWQASGVLEHQVEGKHCLPIEAAWSAAGHEWSTPASETQKALAGLSPDAPALWHNMAGWVRPQRLVQAQLNHPNIRLIARTPLAQLRQHQSNPGDQPVWTLLDSSGNRIASSPCVVLACGFDTRHLALEVLEPFHNPSVLPLNALRGQVSWGELGDLPEEATLAPFPVNGHGSFLTTRQETNRRMWISGATFERGATTGTIKAADHDANLNKLKVLLPRLAPHMAAHFQTAKAWAGVRCTLPDRLPAVGAIAPQVLPGLHLCTAMGARGISLSVLCGELLAAWLLGEPTPLPPKLALKLWAGRFAGEEHNRHI